jgi:hypothetical protein
LETVVDHYVIDPVAVFARGVADDRREADNLAIPFDNQRRVLKVIAIKPDIASR